MDNQPEPQYGPHWYKPDQEAKSLAQAAKFKAVNPDVLLFPYITGFLAQNSFKAQETFNQPEHADWWLRDPISNAPLDCNQTTSDPNGLAPGHGTCFGWSQGFPGKLYDWRIPAVRSYWTNQVRECKQRVPNTACGVKSACQHKKMLRVSIKHCML